MTLKTASLILGAALLVLAAPAFSKKSPTGTKKAATVFIDQCKTTNIGTDRWAEKTEISAPPANAPAETVANVLRWDGPGGTIQETGDGAKRVAEEKEFYQVTGQVYTILVESDGDVHIKLIDTDDADPTGTGVHFMDVEIPPAEMDGNSAKANAYNNSVEGNPWCDLRTTVLGWTNFKPGWKYPSKLQVLEKPVITVTGMRFYDIDHRAGDNTSKVRKAPDNHTAVWEIHPVMQIVVKAQ